MLMSASSKLLSLPSVRTWTDSDRERFQRVFEDAPANTFQGMFDDVPQAMRHAQSRARWLEQIQNQLKLGTAWTVTLWSPSPRISTTHLPSLVESKWGRLSTDARCYQSCAMFAVGKLWRGTNALRTGIRRRSQEPNHMKQTVGGFSKTWVSAIQDGKEKNSL